MSLEPSQFCLFISDRNKYMANELPIASYAVTPAQVLVLKPKTADWKPDPPIVDMLGVSVENIQFRQHSGPATWNSVPNIPGSFDDLLSSSNPPSSSSSSSSAPAEYESWSVDQVCEWVRSIGMEDQASFFRDGGIDGKALAEATPVSLRNIGIQALGVRKEIIRQVRTLK
jgi:hypothetical protein